MDRPFVIDGVCHPYNFSRANQRGRFGKLFCDVMYSYFPAVNPPEIAFPRDRWEREWQPDEFIETMLLESDTDICCVHSLPIYDAWVDGLAAWDKAAYLKRTYPDRVLWYAGIDMFDPIAALEEAKKYLDLGCDGLKFYPSRSVEGRTEFWLMDDEARFPVYQRALDYGIKNIAVHKALPLGPVASYGMQVDDISAAANTFPDLNFQIVHAGFMFLDETKFLLANHRNVYATLEATVLLCMLNPPAFTRLMEEFLGFAGPDKLIYASAAVNPHPHIVLEAFAKFQMPASHPLQLTPEVRAKFLGGNLARLHGIELAARRAKLASDKFSQWRAIHGLRRPWAVVHGAGP